MEDNKIVDLYWLRDESAISKSEEKYSRYTMGIAMRILSNIEASEECVNDTWYIAWKHMPPDRPSLLKGYFGAIVRNLSINRVRDLARQKRGGGIAVAALDELLNCVAGSTTPESTIENSEITSALNRWLEGLPREKRVVFMLRYWHCYSIAEISERLYWSESKTNSALARLRKSLREHLRKEEIYL